MEIFRPLAILFAFCYLLLSLTFIFHNTINSGRRLALMQSFIVVGELVWFITEFLSIFNAVTFANLARLWGITCLVILVIVVKVSDGKIVRTILNEIRYIQKYLISLPKGLLVILIIALISMAILGLIAFIGAPNTWDSMTYHLSRVMHWEQNHSIAFYPTSIERQLHLGPLAEMFILNFQILAGNDRLANFVQFFAMIGCIIGVSLITKMLGGNIYAQFFSSMTVATLPMGILQSTSTQNDYVVALWLVCFVSMVLEQLLEKNISRIRSLLMGISLGLAVLTKVTALLFGASFGIWLAFAIFRRFKMNGWKEIIILIGVALIIVVPHAARNFGLYKTPFGPMTETGQVEYKYTNDSYSFSAFASNALRNVAIHLALPFDGFNNSVEKMILRLHTILRIDINDPKTTWIGTSFSVNYSTNENLAGNPFHLLLIVVSILALVH